jgi:hypothetical protein
MGTKFSLHYHLDVFGAGGWEDSSRVLLLHKLLDLRMMAVDCFAWESDFGSRSVLTGGWLVGGWCERRGRGCRYLLYSWVMRWRENLIPC